MITFSRPEPTPFVICVARTGRGSGNVLNTENFKPPGTEWATDQDLRDAGYVRLDDALKALRHFAGPVSEWDTTDASRKALAEALRMLGVDE